MGELAAYLLSVDPSAESWAGSQYASGLQFYAAFAYAESGLLGLGVSEISNSHPFRCVPQATN